MATVKTGITLAAEGEKEFRKAISNINQQMKTMKSELKATTAEFNANGKESEALKAKQKGLAEQIVLQKEKIAKLREATQKATEAYGENSNKTLNWKNSMYQAQSQLVKLEQELKNVNSQTERNTPVLDRLTDSQRKYETEMKAASSEMKLLQSRYSDNSNSAKALNEKQSILNKQIDIQQNKVGLLTRALQEASVEYGKNNEKTVQLKDSLYQAKAELIDFEEQLKKVKEATPNFDKLTEQIDTAGEKIQGLGKKTSVVSGAVAATGLAAAKSASSFEDAIAKVSTIADESEVPIEDLQKAILELSDQTGIASTDIAENVYNAISAGQKTGDAVNFVSNATKLAKAGFTDSAAATDILTTALNAYGLEASEVTNISDLLINTQNLGKTTVNELASAMGKVIPTAKADNVQMDQLATSYAILTSKGIATAESTTYLNSMLNEMGKSGSTVDGILREKTGKSFKELSADGKTLGEILEIVNESAVKNKKSFSDMFSSSEAAKAGVVLLGDSAEDFNGVLEKMQTCTGATDTAFSKIGTTSKTINVTLNKVKNSGTGLGQAILTAVTPKLNKLAEVTDTATKKFNALNDKQKNTIVVIGGVVAAAGPALIALGKMATGISAVIKTIKTAGTAVSALSGLMAANPVFGGIALTVAGVAALTAGIVALSKATGDHSAAVKQMTDTEEQHIAAVNDSKKAYDETMSARNENVKSISAEYANLQALSTELDSIVDENGKVKEGYEDRANTITGLLSNALGIEISMTDGVIDNYQDLKGSIDDVIRSKQVEALLNANEAAYTEAIEKRTEAFTNMSNIQQDVQKTEAELAEQKQKYNQAMRDYNDAMKKSSDNALVYKVAIADAEDEIERLNKNLDEQNNSLNSAQEIYAGYVGTIDNYNSLMGASVSGNAEDIENAINKMTNNWISAENGTRESLQNQVTNMENTFNAMQQAIEQNAPGVTQEMVDSQANMVALAKAELDKLAPQAETATTNAGNAAAEGLMKTTPMVTNASFDMIMNSKRMIEAVDLSESGQNAAQEVADGIESKEGDIEDATENSFSGANAYIKSLPGKGHEWGADFGDGLISGMKSKNSGIASAAEGIAGTIRSFLHFSVPDEGPLTDYESWMPDFMEGLSEGISKNKFKVTNQIKGLAKEMNLDVGAAHASTTAVTFNSEKLDRLCQLAEQYFPQIGNVNLDGKAITRTVSGNMLSNRGLCR